MTASNPGILLIGGDNPTTWIVYNRLIRDFGLFPCIIEEPVAKSTLLRNRARKLGWFSVLGQAAFVTLIRPLLSYQGRNRIAELCRLHDMETKAPFTPQIQHVENINDPAAIELVRKAAPRIIVVNGTRILKQQILDSVPALFINTHQGVTPRYRGAHGAYWALYESDREHCGVTVHLVDKGIDTGNIIGQSLISPEPSDSFVTYPYLQTAAALPILANAIRDVFAGKLVTEATSGPSAVWYHPTVWQYLRARLRSVR